MNLTYNVCNKGGHDSKSFFQWQTCKNKGKGCDSDGFKRGGGHSGQQHHGWASVVMDGSGLLGAVPIGAAMTAAGTG
ncbi:hypothetical protein M9H77_25966 [Catharanthus roseus]|uniref:Uncharacterized protein n=1 Tax=Catharanthus roseus TaxID=4058 RepID=A0ACC0ACL8_CATRO|nr:hypothetical protein M9H77_25966 [Catharanthus roseus]